MIYKKNRVHSRTPGGFFSFEEEKTKTRIYGFGYGDSIRLRDEFGETWRGTAELGSDETVHYTFRNSRGRVVTGVVDGIAIVLRDARGKTWRGLVD